MGPWIEVYDSEGVQLHLRQAVAGYSAMIAATISITVFLASMVAIRALSHEVILLTLGVAALCAAVYLTGCLISLQSRVWCIKLSPHMIMGYNHSRDATVFAWSQVDRIEIGRDSISIIAGRQTMIEIPSSFDDFPHVSHRILDLAELHRRPVHIRGKSIEDVDLFSLMPDLKLMLSEPLVSGPEPA